MARKIVRISLGRALLGAVIATAIGLAAAQAQTAAPRAPAPLLSGNPVPPQGWALPEPATGWGGIPSAGTAPNRERRGNRDLRAQAGGTGVGLPFGLETTDHAFTITGPAREQTANPVPGLDTHPTVEQTPLGIDIVRGPAGQ